MPRLNDGITGDGVERVILLMMDFNHNPSLVVRVVVMYSASVEERATIACFFVRHEMAPPANRNT